MDQLLTADNYEAIDEFDPSFNSFLSLSESNCFDKFSNPVDNGIGRHSKNEKIEPAEESSDRLVDAKNHSSVYENDVSSISFAKNEAIENGDDPSVAEKNQNSVKSCEKVDTSADFSLEPNEATDNVSKKEVICGSRDGDTNLPNDGILDSDRRNNLVPTNVEICGDYSDVKLSNSFTPPEDNTCPRDITMKEELLNNVPDNDCIHTEPVHRRTSFPNELFNNKKSENTEVGDPVVICKEETSKLPSRIPVKVKSYIKATSQPNSSQIEKYVAEKRFTRSSLSKSNGSIVSSSSCGKDSVPNSKKPKKLSKNGPYSSSSYSCHLCNTVFQEHESLNEHMILHRKNGIAKSRSKTAKLKPYSCNICKKELSTSQSLQQHVLIHKNVKPFGCHICHKDFRHLSNFRMHMQKHKAEQDLRNKTQRTDSPEQFDESVHSVDFGRIGPFFMKENLTHRERSTISNTSRSLRSATSSSVDVTKKTTLKPFNSTKKTPSCRPQLSFDQPSLKIKKNTTSSIPLPVVIRRQVSSPDSVNQEECTAVRSFKSIENVVMNASKIIVKLDNLDTSVLKRKLATPDISIDQLQKKRRIQLTPIAEKYNVKLDEIENIPMDVDAGEIDLPPVELEDDQFDDYLNEINGVANTRNSVYPLDTLSDNELFALLNDDRDTSTATTISVDSAGDDGRRDQISQPEHQNLDAKTIISPDSHHSSTIFEETSPSYEISCYEDETVDQVDDAFDTAFQKVATRRLALLQKRAAENGGKIARRYLLGPLFWCKALKRAKKCSSAAVDSDTDRGCGGSPISNPAKTWPGVRKFGSRRGFDNGRTNDPIELQSHAEKKFESLLKRAKIVTNANALNLAGPLFWRRTLQLAGVRRGEDLRTLMNVPLPTLEGVEFVGCDFDAEVVDVELLETPPDPVPIGGTSPKSNDQQNDNLPRISPITTGIVDDVSKLPDQISSATRVEHPICDNTATSDTLNDIESLETDSVFSESLTEPHKKQQHPVIEPDNVPASDVHCGVFIDNHSVASSLSNNCQTELPENCSLDTLNLEQNELTGNATVADNRPVGRLDNDSDSIVLNVVGKNSQLMYANNDQEAIPEAGQNFVLVSDGNGTMQYLVSLTNENYPNFESIGDNGCGYQVAYAFQFNAENCTAVQFVQDGYGFQLQSDGGLKEVSKDDSKPATYLISNADAAATAVVSDPSHIGKELSDFLNLDYGSLFQTGAVNESSS